MSIIKKISEKIFGVKTTTIDQLINIKDKALQSRKTLHFKIAGSLQESKKISQNLKHNEIRQIELQEKAKQFLLLSDENGAKIALKKKNLLITEDQILNSSLESETQYLEQLKQLFAELEARISEINSAINVCKQRKKQDLSHNLSSGLLSETANLNEIEKLTDSILIKAKRDDFMRVLEMDTDLQLSNDNISEDTDDLVENQILDMKKHL